MVNTLEFDFTTTTAIAVEDDAGGVAIIGVLMRYLGMRAYLNTTGRDVIPLAVSMKPPPDIILLDINLPDTTGYDVLKQIRACPELKDVLVIAVTAQDADVEIPKAQAAGFDGFIGKPISRSRFPRQLRRILTGDPVWETY